MKTELIYAEPHKTGKKRLQKYYKKAKSLLENEKEMERFLHRLETKLNKIPKCGNKLAYATNLASMLNSYFHKTYTQAPVGTIFALVAALLYLVVPIDCVPDFIPWLGYIDDAGVLTACVALVKSDIEKYLEWREATQMLND